MNYYVSNCFVYMKAEEVVSLSVELLKFLLNSFLFPKSYKKKIFFYHVFLKNIWFNKTNSTISCQQLTTHRNIEAFTDKLFNKETETNYKQ